MPLSFDVFWDQFLLINVFEGHEPNFLEDLDDVFITILFIDGNFVLRMLHFLLEEKFFLEGDSDGAPVD